MKIEYIRNVQSGYMRIAMAEPLNKIEEEMLIRNTIEGILSVWWQKEDDKYLLRYDITGKQALDALLENTLVDESIMRSLLVGICVAVKQLEKYLLLSEGILLLPETIFWDAKSETMHFCYYPEIEESLQLRLARLMEYVLAKTDHKNVLAVQLVYGIYEEVQKDGFSINGLQAYLLAGTVSERETALENNQVEEGEDVDIVENQREVLQYVKDACRKRSWKINVVETIMGWIKKKIKSLPREKKPESKVVFETEEVPAEWMETRILSTIDDEIKGVLKYEGVNLLPDIVVSKVPFTIGSAKDCDGVINYPTISRYHAKISITDGVYFIEDLNSTNGTKTKGGLLSYKTRVSIKKNECIYFANEQYRFL